VWPPMAERIEPLLRLLLLWLLMLMLHRAG
jgi:hypothetical protein